MGLLAQGITTVPLLLQVGVGGIFAILILRLVFDFIERREMKRVNGPPGIAPEWAREALNLIKKVVEKQATIATQIGDLHDWHKPEDGVQEWKNKAMIILMRDFKEAMEKASERSAKALENNNELLKRIIPVLVDAEKKM